MSRPVRLAVVGVGGIGRIHARTGARLPDIELVAVADLDAAARGVAAELGVPVHTDYRAVTDVDGVVVAVPNQLHEEVGCHFAERGVHVLVEKPIADSVASGRRLCDAAAAAGVQLLVGHHRRHNNLASTAHDVVGTQLGGLVATNALVTMRKPESYYAPDWRREAGAGPLLVNLIHEVDLQRAVCGEIDSVQAIGSSAGRGFDFDDTATILFEFTSGAVGCVVVSDSVPSPWSWESSVSEGMGFHDAGQDYARFLGTQASLSFPSMTLWTYDRADGEPGWHTPLHARRIDVERNDPYRDQLAHFADVIRGDVVPLVTGDDGLRSLAVVEAVVASARTRRPVDVDDMFPAVTDDVIRG